MKHLCFSHLCCITSPLLLALHSRSHFLQPCLSPPTLMHLIVVTAKFWSIQMIMHWNVMSVLNDIIFHLPMSVKNATPFSWTIVASLWVCPSCRVSIKEAVSSTQKLAVENQSLRMEVLEIRNNSSKLLHILNEIASNLPLSHNVCVGDTDLKNTSCCLTVLNNPINPAAPHSSSSLWVW